MRFMENTVFVHCSVNYYPPMHVKYQRLQTFAQIAGIVIGSLLIAPLLPPSDDNCRKTGQRVHTLCVVQKVKQTRAERGRLLGCTYKAREPKFTTPLNHHRPGLRTANTLRGRTLTQAGRTDIDKGGNEAVGTVVDRS